MQYLKSFENSTGKAVPERIQQFFLKEEYKNLIGKNIKKPFSELLEDNDIEYASLILEADFSKMEMLVDWSNDGYYSDEIYIPLYTIKEQTTTFVAIDIINPDGSVYFFDKDTGFIDMEITLDDFMKKLK